MRYVALGLLVWPARVWAQSDEKTWQGKVEALTQEVQQLRKEFEGLRTEKEKFVQENETLRRDLQALRTLSEESAREVLELRRALRQSGGVVPEPAEGQPSEPGATPGPAVGPKEILRAKVLAANAEYGFVLIDKGERDGVMPGYRFDIVRRTPITGEGGQRDWRFEKLGVGEFEKYVGQPKTQSKLKIIEGKAQDMKYEDEAVAHRKIEGSVGGAREVESAPVPAPGEKKFRITGKVGDDYMLDYGTRQGAKQSDRVFVYRDGRVRAHLRLDVVQKDWSVARLIDKTQAGDFGEGDEILLKEPRVLIVGRVKWNDEARGIIIEVGLKNGAKPGMQFEVRRQGRKLGVVVVKKCLDYVSEVGPVGEFKREDVSVDDFVESIE